jgi:hypothetical protein
VPTLPALAQNKAPAGTAAALSDKKWQALLGLIASGTRVRAACKQVGIGRRQLEGSLRVDAKRREAFEDAKSAALMKIWDEETVEEILAELAMDAETGSLKRILEDKGLDPSSFYALMRRVPAVKEAYAEARVIQAEVMADQMLEIAKDGTNDVIQRSKLRVDTIKWIMSKMHYQRFGDKIQQDVNANIVVDHAERLENARKRREKLNQTRNQGDKSG